MPQFTISVPHDLGKEEAAERVRHVLEKVTDRFGDQVKNLEQSWEGDTLQFSFRTFGINVSGQGVATDSSVDVTVNLPITAMMFKGKIESGLREQLTRMLGSGKSEEK